LAPRGSNPREGQGESAPSDPQRDGRVENRGPRSEDADVLLDVPVLNVEKLDLEVQNLRAHIAARAELAGFLKISVGVDAYLDEVKLETEGVEAQVTLEVKLERILGTIDRALKAIEGNPDLLVAALRSEDGDNAALQAAIEGPDGLGDAREPTDEETAEVEATEAARKKAAQLGVDLAGIEGTGSGGRVVVRDVQKAAR
jgi:pyruvate/2-oxoglutarate dehydrogenase complex dihydrolipoamide acyltransferase (E2) component